MQGLSENIEDYLETILKLEATHKVARVKDIAARLGVLSGTVTSALRSLADKGLVNYEPYSYITLTTEGHRIAREIHRRHTVIKDFLQCVLLLSEDRAEKNACRMEHAMDQQATDRLVKFIEYIHNCPRTGSDWIDAFVNFYSREKHDTQKCRQCLDDCLTRYKESGRQLAPDPKATAAR